MALFLAGQVLEADREIARNLRRQRIFRDVTNPLDLYDDDQLYARYRFDRPSILWLTDLIHDDIAAPTLRNRAILPVIQLCIFLRFLASGCFQSIVGDTFHVDKSTVSRKIHSVATALARHLNHFVRFPDVERLRQIKEAFYNRYRFPSVVGAIDCTHIRIQAPAVREDVYVNRKSFHSLNVQAVCDHDLKITNLVVKWPGRVHDARIWELCDLREELQNGLHNGLLLGDSGYPCQPWLMTPITNPAGAAEERYNRSQTRARNPIERLFGVWKRRFHALHGEIRLEPGKVCTIVAAAAVLHNVARDRRLPDFHDLIVDDQPDVEPYQAHQDENVQRGQAKRARIVREFFGGR